MPATLVAKLPVDGDAALFVELHAGLLQAEAFDIGRAADRDQDHVGNDAFRGAALGGLDGKLGLGALGFGAGDFLAEAEFDALLGQQSSGTGRRFRCPWSG